MDDYVGRLPKILFTFPPDGPPTEVEQRCPLDRLPIRTLDSGRMEHCQLFVSFFFFNFPFTIIQCASSLLKLYPSTNERQEFHIRCRSKIPRRLCYTKLEPIFSRWYCFRLWIILLGASLQICTHWGWSVKVLPYRMARMSGRYILLHVPAIA